MIADAARHMLTADQILKFNDATAKHQARNFSWNEHSNWQRIRDQAHHGPVAMETLPHAVGIPAVITGSGPTLDGCLERLKDFEGVFFAELLKHTYWMRQGLCLCTWWRWIRM